MDDCPNGTFGWRNAIRRVVTNFGGNKFKLGQKKKNTAAQSPRLESPRPRRSQAPNQTQGFDRKKAPLRRPRRHPKTCGRSGRRQRSEANLCENWTGKDLTPRQGLVNSQTGKKDPRPCTGSAFVFLSLLYPVSIGRARETCPELWDSTAKMVQPHRKISIQRLDGGYPVSTNSSRPFRADHSIS